MTSGQKQKPRVFGDFQNSDRLGRVRLNTVGTKKDVDVLGLTFVEGAEIVVYDMELEADAKVTYSSEEKLWVAVINWEEIRDRAAQPFV